MALSELLNIAKYSSGYHGDGPAAAAPDYSFLTDGGNKKQEIALKLNQLAAQVKQAQANAAIAQRKSQLWAQVGNPTVTDKSNAGDVTSIVDTEKVGGRDANVSNRGEVDLPDLSAMQSNSKVGSMIGDLQPKVNTAGNMVLAKKKTPYAGASKQPYDEARTFGYAKRLADQDILSSGKTKKDIPVEDYSAMVKQNIPKAEKYLYGKALSQPEAASVTPQAAAPGTVEAGKLPDAPQVQAYQEGQTAINPKTGKRLTFKGGKWQSIN